MPARAILPSTMLAMSLVLGLFIFGCSHGRNPTEESGVPHREGTESLAKKPKAPRIHHILLEVKNLEASTAFYQGQFGFELESKSGDFAMLKGDNVDIYLWEKRWDWEKRNSDNDPHGLGMYPHFLVENVKQTVERLKQSGARIIQEPRVYPTFTEAFVADPDGYTWALISIAK